MRRGLPPSALGLSVDRTADVLAELEGRYPCVRSIHHERNLGYGAAVHAALSAAAQDLLLATDSDRQFALGDIDGSLR